MKEDLFNINTIEYGYINQNELMEDNMGNFILSEHFFVEEPKKEQLFPLFEEVVCKEFQSETYLMIRGGEKFDLKGYKFPVLTEF